MVISRVLVAALLLASGTLPADRGEGSGVLRLKAGWAHLSWGNEVVAGDSAGFGYRHQRQGLADAPAHVLVGVSLQKGLRAGCSQTKSERLCRL